MRFPSSLSGRKRNPRTNTGNIIDSLFKDLEKNLSKDKFARFGNADIYEKDNSLFYEIELPGLDKQDVKVQKRNDKLVVAGQVRRDSNNDERNYISRGRRYGKFRRAFPLPDVDEAEKIEGSFENGVLKVEVPLQKTKEEEGTVKIEIE